VELGLQDEWLCTASRFPEHHPQLIALRSRRVISCPIGQAGKLQVIEAVTRKPLDE
jgi:hypothetical protein